MKREPIEYPRGYFTELVLAHNFPPNFKPQPVAPQEAIRREAAARGRATALAKGHTGTLRKLSSKSVNVQPNVAKAMVQR